jgi:hypothetical protein
MFRRNKIPPSSESKNKSSKPIRNLSRWLILIGSTAYSSILKMEAVGSSETSVNYLQTIWRHITEGKVIFLLNIIEMKFTHEYSHCVRTGDRICLAVTRMALFVLWLCVLRRVKSFAMFRVFTAVTFSTAFR